MVVTQLEREKGKEKCVQVYITTFCIPKHRHQR